MDGIESIVANDVDPSAVEAIRRNVSRNGLGPPLVTARAGDASDVMREARPRTPDLTYAYDQAGSLYGVACFSRGVITDRSVRRRRRAASTSSTSTLTAPPSGNYAEIFAEIFYERWKERERATRGKAPRRVPRSFGDFPRLP